MEAVDEDLVDDGVFEPLRGDGVRPVDGYLPGCRVVVVDLAAAAAAGGVVAVTECTAVAVEEEGVPQQYGSGGGGDFGLVDPVVAFFAPQGHGYVAVALAVLPQAEDGGLRPVGGADGEAQCHGRATRNSPERAAVELFMGVVEEPVVVHASPVPPSLFPRKIASPLACLRVNAL